jgi:hypothetical protein
MNHHLKLSFSAAALYFVCYKTASHSYLLSYIFLWTGLYWWLSVYNFYHFSFSYCRFYRMCTRLFCFYFLLNTHYWGFFPSMIFRLDFRLVYIDITEIFFWIACLVQHAFVSCDFVCTLILLSKAPMIYFIFYKMRGLVFLSGWKQIHSLHIHTT